MATESRHPSCRIDGAVNHMGIEPGRSVAQPEHAEACISNLLAPSKGVVISFIHIIFIEQYWIERRSFLSNRFSIALVSIAICFPRDSKAGHGSRNRQDHE